MKRILLFAALILGGISARSQVYYSQDFEGATVPGVPTGLTETHTGNGDGWETHVGPTRWPVGDISNHTKYCLVNDHKKWWNELALLTTPTFSMVGATNPRLSFDKFHTEFWGYERAWVELSTNGGTSYSIVDTVYASGVWLKQYSDLSSFPHTANCKLRFGYHSTPGMGGSYKKSIFGFAIDNIKVAEAVAGPDLGINYIMPETGIVESYVKVGDSAIFMGGIGNSGPVDVAAYEIEWRIGSGAIQSQYFSSPSCPGYSSTGFTAFSIPYVPSAPGAQTIKIWVKAAGDVNPQNDTITTVITGVAAARWPLKHLFTEEVTGTWCGWCPRGIVFLDSLWKLDSARNSIVCVHSKFNYDGMADDNITTRIYDTFTNRMTTMGYPSVNFDRRMKMFIDNNFINYYVRPQYDRYAFAEIGVTHTTTGGVLKARATIKPQMELSGDHRLELIVQEEAVTGTDWKFQQANAYHLSPLDMEGCGYDFDDSADVIAPGSIKFRFVARWTIPEDLEKQPHGIAGSLPSALHVDSFYSYNFPPVTIPANWKAEKLNCIALLIDNNIESPNYGYVLNSASTKHPPLIGGPTIVVSEVAEQPVTLHLYPNPAKDEVTVAFTLNEATVTDICIYDMQGRRIAVIPAAQQAGKQTVKVSTTDLAAGVYTVMLRSGTLRESRMLTVIK